MVNLFPVNLEYLQFVDLDNPDQQRLVDATINAQLDSLAGITVTDKTNTLILGTIVWEYSIGKNVSRNLQYFQKKCQDIGIQNHFLVGLEKKLILSDFDNCTFIDFFLLRSYYKGTQTNQILNSIWHPENKKFLFLMGKALKPNRIGLLYRFYKQGMLDYDQSVWSFYQTISVTKSKNYVPKDTNLQDLEIFLKNYQRFPDGVYPIHDHYGGFPFDPLLYKNTNISVVSETQLDIAPWNTEKIYRAILNHHPFVIAGPPGHTQHLQDMGFETFDQYFAVPDYSSIDSLDSRLDAIVENIKKFDPSTEQIEEIHHATKRNFQRLHELAKHYIDTIDNVLKNYGISQSWTTILPLENDGHFFLTWQYYYQKIKDPSWPSCNSVSDCVYLPAEIQQELRTKFDLNF